jgi:dienelactone hydrolase
MSPPLFYFAGSAGPHRVGLKVVEQYDYSRSYRGSVDQHGRAFKGERSRPIQTLIWYPAERGDAPPMTVGGYLDLWATQVSFGAPVITTRAAQWRSGLAPTLSMPLWAIRDAPPAPGRFPVVIYSPGLSSPAWDNADLCEYLASHGYVVLASSSLGVSSRSPTHDLAGIEPQARDISFLVGYAHSLSNADTTHIAAAGFSWGGICNIFAAARDARIGALVCLDGSVRFSPGLVRQTRDVIPEQMTIPLLSISQGQWSPEEKALIHDAFPTHAGPDVLNAWTHGDLTSVYLLGFGHGDHSSMAQRNEDEMQMAQEIYGTRKVDYGREDGIAGFAWLARYTLEYLNAYLKEDASGMAFLRNTPVENGAPVRFMTTSFRPATGETISFESFRAALHREGYAQAAEVYSRFRRARPAFEFDEQTLGNWAEELSDADGLTQAMAVLELCAQLNPESGAACLQLGDCYRRACRESAAVEQYQLAMQKKPSWIALRAAARLKAPVPPASLDNEVPH